MPHVIQSLFVATSYPSDLKDWRGLFIRHLADALARCPGVCLSLTAPPGDTHPSITRTTTPAEDAWLERLMRDGGIAHIIRQGGLKSIGAIVQLMRILRSNYRRSTIDLYHINWLQNALPLPNDRKPLIVSVLGTDLQLINKLGMKPLLRRVFRQHPTTICPNAEWMVEPLKAAFGDLARIQFIPFGIDPAWFAITRTPTHPAKWLVVSRLTKAKIGPLFDWCQPIFDGQPRELHLFGPMQEPISVPDWVHYHGATHPEALLHDWFPAAQGLITLSEHAEGRPQVMLEAMAAGLPIIASQLPAHENIVMHGQTGWLCRHPQDVLKGVFRFEQSTANQTAGQAARQFVKQHIGTWDDCAQRYLAEYHHQLQESHYG